MSLLVPNTRHPHSNDTDLIFCLPVPYSKWNKWKALSDAHNKRTQHHQIRFVDRVEGGTLKTVLILPEDQNSDDDVLADIAYMRMVDGVTCKVYVIRGTHSTLSNAQIMNAVIGADPSTIMEVDDDELCSPRK